MQTKEASAEETHKANSSSTDAAGQMPAVTISSNTFSVIVVFGCTSSSTANASASECRGASSSSGLVPSNFRKLKPPVAEATAGGEGAAAGVGAAEAGGSGGRTKFGRAGLRDCGGCAGSCRDVEATGY